MLLGARERGGSELLNECILEIDICCKHSTYTQQQWIALLKVYEDVDLMLGILITAGISK